MVDWQTIIAGLGLLITLILALAARDRSMFQAIAQARDEARISVAVLKDDTHTQVVQGIADIHERITRLRDGTLSIRDGEAMEKRMEKAVDELKAEQRRMLERLETQNREAAVRTDAGFRELKQLVNSLGGIGALVVRPDN